MMELARITQELQRLEQQSDVLESQMKSEAAEYQAQSERGLTIEAMLGWQSRLDARRTALRQAQETIGGLTTAWSTVQARLIEVTQDRKVIDRLAERRKETCEAESQRREQYAMDEAASRLWGNTEKDGR